MQQPGWLPSFMLFTNVLKHDFHDCWYFLFSYVSRFDFSPPSCTARTHGSCTHSRACLYMQGYFQTELVKDIQPVVNTGFEGGVSVFSLSCLFTGALLSTSQRDKSWWRQFEKRSTSPLLGMQPWVLILFKISLSSQYFKNHLSLRRYQKGVQGISKIPSCFI